MKWITFSRKMGTNGSEIARKVADELGYLFYETEAINRMAQQMGILDSVREADERVPSIFHRLFSLKPTVYFDRLYSVIYELARQGDAVFLGRGSHILLRAFDCALHVRVTASLQTRIQSLVGRGFTPEAAARAISRSDGEREAFIRFAFGVDWENPELYDLVLNMDKLPVGLAVRTVVDLARSKEIAEASVDALRSLEMMALRNRADAALIEAGLSIGRTASASVSVVKPGTLRLEGFVASQEEKREAETVLQSVRGVETIENALRVIPQVIVAGHTT
jgi:cytidylate kinase